MPLQGNNPRKLIIISLVLGVTLLHALTKSYETFFHLVYRELYFLPIILAGFWFGLRGGFATSLLASFFYGSFLAWNYRTLTDEVFSGILQILLFNVIGILLGWLRDREAAHQEQLRQTENLAAMGRALSAVAHDLKTPLTAIGGFTEQVRRRLEPEDPGAAKLDLVLAQTRRLEVMVRDMLSFTRPLQLETEPGDLNELVHESARLVARIAEEHRVRVKVQTESRALTCSFDRNRLQQVVLNLLVNAIEASPAEQEVVLRSFKKAGERCFEVADHGRGIPPAEQRELFKPFFTTKKEGTGLGLAIARKIVEAHGGTLNFRENKGPGTTFGVCLPSASQEEES